MGLSVKDFTFSYKDRPLFSSLTIQFKENNVHILMGSNGSGKSTLMKCLLGYYRGEGGEIDIDGKGIQTLTSQERASLIAYVPQSTHLQRNETVYECVMAPILKNKYSEPNEALKEAHSALVKVGMEDSGNRSVDTLSGGQRQRILIARALAQNTKYILLDEPISSLDIQYQVEVMLLIRDLVDKHNRTVICIVHDLNFGYEFGNTITFLKEGQLIYTGNPIQGFTLDNIEKVFNVRMTQSQDGYFHIGSRHSDK